MPGHGTSTSTSPTPEILHPRDLEEAAPDVHQLIRDVVLPRSQGRPVIGYGHSMGGQTMMESLQSYNQLSGRRVFDGAIFSDPMLTVGNMGLPSFLRPALVAIFKTAARFGYGDQPAPVSLKGLLNPPKGKEPLPVPAHETPREKQERLHCQNLSYTRRPSINWVLSAVERGEQILDRKHLKAVDIPVLIGSCGLKPNDLVLTDVHATAAKTMKATLVQFPEVRHNLHLADDENLKNWMKRCIEHVESIVQNFHGHRIYAHTVPAPTQPVPILACQT